MNTPHDLPLLNKAQRNSGLDCLEVPELHGAARLQAYLVDRIKRAAIRRLHCSVHGERWLLHMYLIGEEATERALHEDWAGEPPAWLVPRMQQHLADEQRHAQLFAQALQDRGVQVAAAHAPDWLSRRKIMRWRSLAQRHASFFGQGVLVPAYAIGLCAEQMAMRVLARHCATIRKGHSMHALLASVLADEARHVRLCEDSLQRLVTPSEADHLATLLREIRAIDASFGVSGALAMYAIAWLQSLRPAPGRA